MYACTQVKEEQKERDAGKEYEKEKKKRQKALCHSAFFFIVPTANGGLMKYVDGWPSQHWEATVSERSTPSPPPPPPCQDIKHSAILRTCQFLSAPDSCRGTAPEDAHGR